MTPMIETEDLRKVFPGRGAKGSHTGGVEAVKGLDLRVDEGEIFGFLGPNGAGKSTTLRLLATLIPPTAGQARIAGCDLRREPGRVRERIGYVGQAGGTDQAATARENLLLQGQLYGLHRTEAAKRTSELLALLELESCADRPARTYSGGQRRRLDLGLGMVHRPRLLFLDEPTTGLDPQSRARLWEEVRRLRAEGTTVFLTTHYLDEADSLADRLAIIDNGRVVVEGTPATLKRQIAGDVVTVGVEAHNGHFRQAEQVLRSQAFVRETYPGDGHLQLYVEEGEASLPTILRLLDGAGVQVQTVALTRPTLDDVFLRQTGRSLRDAE
jgi:ABC-2 type transport system ATP-binding protein